MGLMARLKEETALLHRHAETHVFQRGLIRGELPISAYGGFLGQMLHVHRALEGALEAMADRSPIREVVDASQFRCDAIRADLAFLGGMPGGGLSGGLGGGLGIEAGEMLDGTRRLVDEIRGLRIAGDGRRLLGMHYVLEGSTNGGRFVSAALARAYALDGRDGLGYLDPYRKEQPQRWAAFAQAVEALRLDDASQDAVVDGAKSMFEGVTGVLESLGEVWVKDTPGVTVLPITSRERGVVEG